jgi:hypothetical protein
MDFMVSDMNAFSLFHRLILLAINGGDSLVAVKTPERTNALVIW